MSSELKIGCLPVVNSLSIGTPAKNLMIAMLARFGTPLVGKVDSIGAQLRARPSPSPANA